LKAMGSECGFLRRSVCETSCWKGPGQVSLCVGMRKRRAHVLTLEAKLHGVKLDGHGAGGDGQLLVIVDTWGAMSHAGACAMAVKADVAELERIQPSAGETEA
jgi:hypothetical protein